MTSGCYCEAKFTSQSSIDSYSPLIFAFVLPKSFKISVYYSGALVGMGMLFEIPKLLSLPYCIEVVTPFPVVSIVDVAEFVMVGFDVFFTSVDAVSEVGWVFVLFASVDAVSSICIFVGSASDLSLFCMLEGKGQPDSGTIIAMITAAFENAFVLFIM